MEISLRGMIKLKDLATLAISLNAKQDLTLRISDFPTGPFLIKISRAIFIHVFRTTQNNPTRIFAFPEIGQFIPSVSALHFRTILKKSNKKDSQLIRAGFFRGQRSKESLWCVGKWIPGTTNYVIVELSTELRGISLGPLFEGNLWQWVNLLTHLRKIP